MGLLRTNEFAALCQIKASSIRTYITRHKLSYVEVRSETGRKVKMLDTEAPLNVIFIDKCKQKQNVQQTAPEAVAENIEKDPESRVVTISKPQNKKNFSFEFDAEKGPQKNSLGSGVVTQIKALDLEAKQLAVAKAREQVEIERMKKEKMQGEVIPTDLVKQLFNQHFRNVTLQFKDEAEKISTIMVKSLGGKNSDKVEVFARLEESINRALDEARALTASDIKTIVEEHSVSRGRGERK